MNKYYNEISKTYDTLFLDDESRQENETVVKIIEKEVKKKNIFDIGCGTGLLLDYLDIDKSKYYGIDPSRGMLHTFNKKHPKHIVQLTTLEGCDYTINECSFVVSLFGSMNYVDATFFKSWFRNIQDSSYFLMFYKDEYSPITYEKAGVKAIHNVFKDFEIDSDKVIPFNNFYIVTNLKGVKSE